MALSLTATYASPPSATAQVAAMWANKRVAFCFQADDGYAEIYTLIFRILNGGVVNGVTYPGIKYNDGTGRLLNAGYGFAINAAATATAANNATLCSFAQLGEMVAAGNFSVLDHSFQHNNSGGTDYEVQANYNAVLAAIGYAMRVGVVPASIADFVRAFVAAGRLLVNSEGFGGDGSPNAAPYSAEVSYGDRLYVNLLNTAPYHAERMISSRHNLDFQWVSGIPAIKQWVDAKFVDAATNGPSIFTAFSHDIGLANAPYLAEMFAYIQAHPSNAGGNEVWLANSQDVAEYYEARRLSVLSTPTVTGNTLALSIDQSAIPAVSRNRSMSLLLPAGMTGVSVTGVDSFTYNPTTGLVNLYVSAASAAPVQRWRPGRSFVTPLTAGTYFLPSARYVTADWFRTESDGSETLVQNILDRAFQPAGQHQLRASKTNAQGQPLDANHFARIISHEQAGDINTVYHTSYGNSSTYRSGAFVWNGGNLPCTASVVKLTAPLTFMANRFDPINPGYVQVTFAAGVTLAFTGTGYAENSRAYYVYDVANPNVVYTVHERTSASPVLMDNDGVYNTSWVFFVFGHGDFPAGPAIIRTRIADGLPDEPFSAGQVVESPARTYYVCDYRPGKPQALGGAVQRNGAFMFRCDGLTLGVLNKSTGALVHENVLVNPRKIRATDTGGWVTHGPGAGVVEAFTVNSEGVITLTGEIVPGITTPGDMDLTPNGQLLDVMDVQEPSRAVFTADNIPNDFTETIQPGELVYGRGRTLRYSGISPRALTRPQWEQLNTATDTAFTEQASPLTSTATHRVRRYNLATKQLVAPFGEGDYANEPEVRPTKFAFLDARFFREDGVNCFYRNLPDGGRLVGEPGNKRTQVFNTADQVVGLVQFFGTTYATATDNTRPDELFIDYHKLKLTFQGASTLTHNYCMAWRPQFDDVFKRLAGLTTLSNGRQYAFQYNALLYRWYEVEVTATTLRPTGFVSENAGARLGRNGTVWEIFGGEQVGSIQQYKKRLLTGFDNAGNPLRGALLDTEYNATVVFTDPQTGGANEPFASGGMPAFDRNNTDINSPTDELRSGAGCFHLGIISPNAGRYNFRNRQSTRRRYTGAMPGPQWYDNGNNTQGQGAWSATLGNLFFTHDNGEFRAGAQCAITNVHTDKGQSVIQVGTVRDGAIPLGVAEIGQGGNGLTGSVLEWNGALEIRVGQEGAGLSGIIALRLTKLLSTLMEHPLIPIADVQEPVSDGAVNLLAGMPANQVLLADITSGAVDYQAPGFAAWCAATGFFYELESGSILLDSGRESPNPAESLTISFASVESQSKGRAGWVLPATSVDLPTWRLRTRVGFEAVGASDPARVYFGLQQLDTAQRLLVELYLAPGENGFQSIMANDAIINTGTPAYHARVFYHVTDLLLWPDSTGVWVKLADFPAVHVLPRDPLANHLRPRVVQARASSSNNGGHGLKLALPTWFASTPA